MARTLFKPTDFEESSESFRASGIEIILRPLLMTHTFFYANRLSAYEKK
jgi:hypothetical protein